MKNLMIILFWFFIVQNLYSQGIEFLTNNTNRLQITNDGKIGIGTITPGELLEVEGGSGGDFFGISIKQNTNNVGYPSLFFKDVNDNVLASIFPHQTKTHLYFRLYSGDFIFDRGGGSSPQMSLRENGNLGIGTSTPDERLHVAGGVRIDGALEDKDGDAGSAGQILSSTATGTDWILKTDITDFNNGGEAGGADRSLGNTDNFALAFKTNSTPRQHIFNNGGIRFDGNVGIFTDPKAPGINKSIDLYDSGTFSNPYIKISGHNSGYIDLTSRRNDITSGKSWRIGSGSGSVANLDRFYIYNSDDGNVFTIRDGGNIGIGTDTPDEKLHVAGRVRIDGALEDKDGEAGSAGQILSSTATGTDWILKTDITDFANGCEAGGADRSLGNTDNFALSLTTNNTVRQKIFNAGGIRFDGNVGIFTDPKAPGVNKAIDLYDSGTYSDPYLKISGHNSGSIILVSRRTGITNGKSWRIGSGSGSVLNLDRFYIYNSDDGNVFTIRDGGNIGIGADIPTAKVDINGSTGYNQLRLQTSYTPTSSSDANGNVGDIAWDEDYMYVKTSAGWKRTALVTF